MPSNATSRRASIYLNESEVGPNDEPVSDIEFKIETPVSEIKAFIPNLKAEPFKPKVPKLQAAGFKPFKPTAAVAPQSAEPSAQKASPNESNVLSSGLDALTLNKEFTPSTPYVHKFRTELCKNY